MINASIGFESTQSRKIMCLPIWQNPGWLKCVRKASLWHEQFYKTIVLYLFLNWHLICRKPSMLAIQCYTHKDTNWKNNGFVLWKDSFAIFFLQFMYILGICLLIELTGGVVALIFRNQVSCMCLGFDHQEHNSQSMMLQLCYWANKRCLNCHLSTNWWRPEGRSPLFSTLQVCGWVGFATHSGDEFQIK